MALKALCSRIFLFYRIGCLVSVCGSRLQLSLGSSGRGVGFDGRDDDLLKFLQGVPDVPAFKDILVLNRDVKKTAKVHPKKNHIVVRDILRSLPFRET